MIAVSRVVLVVAVASSVALAPCPAGTVCREAILPPVSLVLSRGMESGNFFETAAFGVSCPQIRSGPRDGCTFRRTITLRGLSRTTGQWEAIKVISCPVITMGCGNLRQKIGNFEVNLGLPCRSTVYSQIEGVDTIMGGVPSTTDPKVRFTIGCP